MRNLILCNNQLQKILTQKALMVEGGAITHKAEQKIEVVNKAMVLNK
jgi:hypothetical protein